MSDRTPNIICCRRPLVWLADDGFWFAGCLRCGRFFTFTEPDVIEPIDLAA